MRYIVNSIAILLAACPGPPDCLFGQVNVLTWHNDNYRTGQNLNESILNLSNVNPSSFGKLFAVPMDGKVDAQPLYLSGLAIPGLGTRNVVFAATEHGSVYAFDADTGAIYWQESLLGSGETPSDARDCNQVVPEIGITATPVIDPQVGPHGTIYVVAMSKNAGGAYFQRLHALDITNGAEQFGGPIEVYATYPGSGEGSVNGAVIFDPKQHKARASLLIDNGVVYTSWGSHCDIQPYTGWLIGYDENSLAQTVLFNFAPNGGEAAIWGSGAGPAADGVGNLFFSVANGTFDTTLDSNGFPINGDYGNTFIRITARGAELTPTSYWTMYNTTAESSVDQDLGSGGLMLLPPLADNTGQLRYLAAGAGKDRAIYLTDRRNMGGFNANDNSNIYQSLPLALAGPEFASPAWFNGQIYFGAVNDAIKAFSVNDAMLSSGPVSQSGPVFPFPGTTPSISAHGTASAILWALENSNPAVLRAFDAGNLGNEIYNSNLTPGGRDNPGPGNKFIVPTVANGKVFIGTTGSVAAFGLLNLGPGPVQLIARHSGKCLDVTDISTQPNAPLQQWTCWGGPNQQWMLTPLGGGAYEITSLNSGMALNVANNSLDDRALITQYPYRDTPNEKWVLAPTSDGYYEVVAQSSGKCLDVSGGPAATGDFVPVQQWACWGGANQQWTLVPF
jgi:outer membrane protein assembly factor BamB